MTKSATFSDSVAKTAESGIDFARFAAVDTSAQLFDAVPESTPQAFAMVVRTQSPSGTGVFASYSGAELARSSSGGTTLKSVGSGGCAVGGTTASWKFVFMEIDPSAPLLRVNTAKVTVLTSGARALGAASGLEVRASHASAIDRATDMAEIITWPRLLDSAECAAVHAAVRALCPALP